MQGSTLDFSVVWRAAPQIADATCVALSVAASSLVLAFAIGLVAALVALHLGTTAARVVTLYVEAMRNSPSLVKLFFLYFGLPELGLYPSAFWSGVIALGLHNGGYLTGTIRAALLAVPPGQTAAGRALGMDWWQVQRVVVMPQALRTGLPALTNVWVEMIKDTSLTSAVAVQELTYVMTALISMTLRSVELLAAFAAIYLCLTLGFTVASRTLERRLRF